MYTDRENTFATRLPVVAVGPVGDAVFVGRTMKRDSLWSYLQPEVSFNNLTSIRFQFVSSASPLLTSPNVIYDSGAVALADFNKMRLVCPFEQLPFTHIYVGWIIPAGGIVGTAPTVGQVTAGLTEIWELETWPRPPYWSGLTPDQGAAYVFVNLEAKAVSDAMAVASGVQPSNARKAIIDTAISGWKAAGTWALKDCLYPLCAGFDAPSMKINWKSPGSFDLVAVGAGTFVPNQGYTPDGVSSYLDSQWDPATNGVNWTQNSSHLLACVKLDTVNTTADVGAQTLTVNRVRARTLTNGTVNLNSATGLNGSAATPASTFPLRALAIRRDASNLLFWRNGAQDGTGASTSAALSTADFGIGKTNNLFSNRPVAGADWGAAYSDAQAVADDAVWIKLVNDCQDLGFYFGSEMADSFAMHFNGPPATTQTGQPYLLNGTHNSVATVTSGRLVAVTPEDAVATYTQVQLSQPGRHIKSRFSFSPYTTTGGAATMGFWAAPMDNDTGTPVQDSPCHLVIAPTLYSFDVWSGNVSTTVRSAFWDTPLLTDGTVYEAEIYLDRVAAIALVTVMQGSTVVLRSEFRHPLIGSVAGPVAFIEHFRSAPTNSLPSFVDWSAA